MLKTLQAPPPKGSLQESVLILLLMKMENIEHARFRALAQILVDKEAGTKAFDEYMKVAFPYMEATKNRDREEYMRLLAKEVARGPVSITPTQSPMMRSKLKTKLATRRTPQTPQEANKLYSKLGQSIPIR